MTHTDWASCLCPFRGRFRFGSSLLSHSVKDRVVDGIPVWLEFVAFNSLWVCIPKVLRSYVISQRHVLKLSLHVYSLSRSKGLLSSPLIFLHEWICNVQILIWWGTIEVIKLRGCKLWTCSHGFETFLPLLKLSLDRICRGFCPCIFIGVLFFPNIVRENPMCLTDSEICPYFLFGPCNLGLLLLQVLCQLVWIEIELILWPRPFSLNQIVANSLDYAIFAFYLTTHHPIIEMLWLLQIPCVIVGHA